MLKKYYVASLSLVLAGCASTSTPPIVTEAPVSRAAQTQAQQETLLPPVKQFKRKIAVGRFTNETRYGRTFQRDASLDPLGKQASDILSARLVASQRFLVFERPDLEKVLLEQDVSGQADLVGVDTLIVGSVTEFGRSTSGQAGFLSSTKVQNAHAKVELRLVDVKTGHAFFSASGTGNASTESGEIAGYGSRAAYDASLNDKAIAAAISDVIGRLITKLEERQWKTDVLKVEGRTVYISGGTRQGIRPGDVLQAYQAGETMVSRQTGSQVTLPARPIAQLRVVSSFGDSDLNEGSQTEVISGTLPTRSGSDIFVGE